jgi:hypothetical protein
MRPYLTVIQAFFLSVFLFSGIEAKSVSEVVVDVKWGSEPGMVGIYDPAEPERMARGPSEIAVDREGNIYILDYINGRINKYDRSGTFMTELSIPAVYFVIGRDERIYTLGGPGRRVGIYEKDGHCIGSYDCSHSWNSLCAEMKLSTPYMDTDGQGNPVVISYPNHIFEMEFEESTCTLVPRERTLGVQGITWPWVEVRRNKDEEITLKREGSKNEEIALSPPEGVTMGLWWSDKDENLYFVGCSSKTWQDGRILKYNKTGGLIDSIPLPSPKQHERMSPDGHKFRAFDETGNIYQLITSHEGVKIMKWSFVQD